MVPFCMNMGNEAKELCLYSTEGIFIQSLTFASNEAGQVSLDVSFLSPGIYIISIQDSNNKVFTRFVKIYG